MIQRLCRLCVWLNCSVVCLQSAEGTVFFFAVGEQDYKPVGLLTVPGPVQGLEWSPYPDVRPPTHTRSPLLPHTFSGPGEAAAPPPPDSNWAR